MILTPKIKRAMPFPAGLMDLEPSSAGNIAAVRPGMIVDNCSFGSLPAVIRIVGMRRESSARKERKNAMRVVRRDARSWKRMAPMIIHVVVRKFEEMIGFSMNLMKDIGAERSLLILKIEEMILLYYEIGV